MGRVLSFRLTSMAMAIAFWAITSGCGVVQFNGKIEITLTTSNGSESVSFSAFGPFLASGQGGEEMIPGTCGSVDDGAGGTVAAGSGTRPCVKARASVGLPFQFDHNPNDNVGAIVTTAFTAGPYSGTVENNGFGAGSVKDPSGSYYLNNKDLHLFRRQVSSVSKCFVSSLPSTVNSCAWSNPR